MVKFNAEISDNLKYHIDNNILLSDTIFRYGSTSHIHLIEEVRELYYNNLMNLSDNDEFIVDSDIGKEAEYEGKLVKLDMPERYISDDGLTYYYIVHVMDDNTVGQVKFSKNESVELEVPYNEEFLGDNIFLRVFTQDTENEDLKWHQDDEDREFEVIGNADWSFQFDNELPFVIKDKVFIKKDQWHRLIKGSGDLNIKLLKF